MNIKYNFNWDNLTQTDFALYCEHMAAGDYNWDVCGQVRVGELCFDFIVFDPCVDGEDCRLACDCYVGGVEGYDWSSRIPNYPYEEGGGWCFPTLCTEHSYEEFVKLAEDAMTDFIDKSADDHLHIKEKARKPLLKW